MLLLAYYVIGVASLVVAEAISSDDAESIEADDLTRDRRLMSKKHLLWPKAILPYIIRPEVMHEEPEYNRVMSFIEDQSCVRFTHWNENTSSLFNLGHQGHANFFKSSGCNSVVGFGKTRRGRNISCCRGINCLHELGHILGFDHEQISQRRDGWIRVNEDNIAKGIYTLFQKIKSTVHNLTYPYDVSSIMHYRAWIGSLDDRGSYTLLLPELSVHGEYFYFFMEMAGGYRCHEKPQCKGKLLKCENDGYQTILHGKCSCKCPTGLDKENLCKTPLKKVTSASWPKGQYALPMPQSGCPSDGDFQDGRLLYSGTGGNSMSDPYHMMGQVEGTKIDLQFCTKTTKDNVYDFAEGEKFNWPNGNYCIYRMGNQCPKGFTTNSIYHRSVSTPSISGKVPDGVYGNEIELKLCCSFRGFHMEPISFPTDKPFTLFKTPKDDNCQAVEGMRFTEETFTFTSSKALTIDPMFLNWETRGKKSLSIKLCYYRAVDMDCGGAITVSKSKPEAIIEMSGSGRMDLQCTWVVKGDTDKGIMVMDFENFSLRKNGDSCDDKVEVRHARIGQRGQEYKSHECPSRHDPRRSIRTIYDKLLVTFSTYGNSKSSFRAKIKWTANEDMCYNMENRGIDYDGSVNYTRSFLPCLPWAEMAECPHNPFHYYADIIVPNPTYTHPVIRKDVDSNLEGNACRNPGNGLRPWCYTEKRGCMREYCDVCGLEKPFDHVDYCDILRNQGFCTRDAAQALYYCANTCQDLLPTKHPWIKYTEISCGQPNPPADGTVVGMLKPKYKVGETVEYKCNKVSSVVMSKCLTSGQWSKVDSSCLPCSSESVFLNNVCFGIASDDRYHYYKHIVRRCRNDGGELAAPRSMDENKVIRKIADNRGYGSISIAITDHNIDGNFRYDDGTDLVWTNWDDGEPRDQGKDCVRHAVMVTNGRWKTKPCKYAYRFVCALFPHELSDCTDVFKDRCSSLFRDRPSFCVDQPSFAGQYCRKMCGFCKENEIRCPLEKPKLNVVALSIKESPISLGEYVKYECDRFKYRVKGDVSRGCLSNGKLSGQPLECGDCPVGFKRLNNTCHGLVLTDANTATFSNAREVCKELGGYLAMPKTEEENDLIASIGMGKTIKIGSSDKYSDINVWDDSVYMGWSNWESDSYHSGKACTVMNSDKKWAKVNCDEVHPEYPLVCTVKEDGLCYDMKNKGVNYDGWVNYTQEFQSCRPWAQTTDCYHHSFRDGDEEKNLEDNYCRNPDNSDRPWCYTDGCSWSYCDVCGTYNPTDRIENCQALKSQGLCTKDKKKAKKDCIETCRDELNMKLPEVTKYTDIRCEPPQPPMNGILVGKIPNTYKIGEMVEIKCKSEPWSVFSRCLTSGQWSDIQPPCTQKDCVPDIFDNVCYNMKHNPKWYPYDEAVALCKKRNGTIAVPRNLEQANLIMDIVEWTYTWLGMTYKAIDGIWVHQNGSQLVWTNWDNDEPDEEKLEDGARCAVMNEKRKWQVEPCELRNHLTCAYPRKDHECSDFYAKCSKQLSKQPSMCKDHEAYARYYCPKTCGFCLD